MLGEFKSQLVRINSGPKYFASMVPSVLHGFEDNFYGYYRTKTKISFCFNALPFSVKMRIWLQEIVFLLHNGK